MLLGELRGCSINLPPVSFLLPLRAGTDYSGRPHEATQGLDRSNGFEMEVWPRRWRGDQHQATATREDGY